MSASPSAYGSASAGSLVISLIQLPDISHGTGPYRVVRHALKFNLAVHTSLTFFG